MSSSSWLGFKRRSAKQIKESIVSKISNPNTGLPEVTDYSDSNPLIKEILIWSGIGENLNYYIDFKARETFLAHQRLFKSAWAKAQEYNYRIKGVSPASGVVTFTLNQAAAVDITIPYGTELETDLGTIVLTIEAVTIPAGSLTIDCKVKQWEKVTGVNLGNSNGTADQTFEIDTDVVDNSITVVVGTTPYEAVDNFITSLDTDSHVIGGLNVDRIFGLTFGDDFNGAIPPNGEAVIVDYYKSTGVNIGVNKINAVNTSLSLPTGVEISVNNSFELTGGSDREGLIDLKRRIPKHNRTNDRAVSDSDYGDIAMLYPGVELADATFDCGTGVSIYIYPENGGIASDVLRNEVFTYFNEKKIIGKKITVYPAGNVTALYNIDVVCNKNYVQSSVESTVKQSIIDYHEEIKAVGGEIRQGNLYQRIESLDGVDYCVINLIQPLPSPIPVNTNTPQLNWTVSVDSNVQDSNWKILFTTATDYKVIIGTQVLGEFVVGDIVSSSGVTFEILQNYSAQDSWTFKTYQVGNSIELDEPSVITTNSQSIVLNMSGGI